MHLPPIGTRHAADVEVMAYYGAPLLRRPRPLTTEEAYAAADAAFLRHLRRVKVRHVVVVCLLSALGSLGVGALTRWLTASSARSQSGVEQAGPVLSPARMRDFVDGLRPAGGDRR